MYSIDEAFCDVTGYLDLYHTTARVLGETIRKRILHDTGIPSACGVGPNLYLAKIALDITAKYSADFFGELDELSYRKTLWNHTPITDFWRVGTGTARRLAALGITTMGELARYQNLERLYDEFGIDAEILIDHAWGVEPVTTSDIKAYRSKNHSLTNAQVLGCSLSAHEAETVVKEMADATSLDLVRQHLEATAISLSIRYEKDARGIIPSSGGTVRLPFPTNSRASIVPHVIKMYRSFVDQDRKVHNLMLVAVDVHPEGTGQMSLFEDVDKLASERSRQDAILAVKEKFGKNALLKGIDLLPEATQRERNTQIGGHKSGE